MCPAQAWTPALGCGHNLPAFTASPCVCAEAELSRALVPNGSVRADFSTAWLTAEAVPSEVRAVFTALQERS